VEVLEEVLRAFQGVLLVVSHDRAFMDNVTDRLLVLKGDGYVRLFDGKYNEVRGASRHHPSPPWPLAPGPWPTCPPLPDGRLLQGSRGPSAVVVLSKRPGA
jgi:ATP-binding cassette subfamily F protein uup